MFIKTAELEIFYHSTASGPQDIVATHPKRKINTKFALKDIRFLLIRNPTVAANVANFAA